MRRVAIVLLVAMVLGHAQFTLACSQRSTGSQRMPCCPSSGTCAAAAVCMSNCAVTIHLVCDQPRKAATAFVAGDNGGQGLHLLVLTWPEPPVAAHHKPPPQGPPSTLLVALTGRSTYLATRRLRI